MSNILLSTIWEYILIFLFSMYTYFFFLQNCMTHFYNLISLSNISWYLLLCVSQYIMVTFHIVLYHW